MLRADSPQRDWFFRAVTAVHLLQKRNHGNGRGIQKGQAPACTGFYRRLQALLPPEGKITERRCPGYRIIHRNSIVFVDDFPVGRTDCRANHRMPQLRTDKRFQCLWKPRKVRMCVTDFKHRHMHRNPRALRECLDFYRKVSELVKLYNFFCPVGIPSECSAKHPVIFSHNRVKPFFKKFTGKILHQVSPDECLQAEHHHRIPHLYPAHARRKIRYGFLYFVRQHVRMHRLIKINQKHRVCMFHRSFSNSKTFIFAFPLSLKILSVV